MICNVLYEIGDCPLSRGLTDDAKETNWTVLTTVVGFELNMCGWYYVAPNIPQCTERVLIPPLSMEGTKGQSDQSWNLANSVAAFGITNSSPWRHVNYKVIRYPLQPYLILTGP